MAPPNSCIQNDDDSRRPLLEVFDDERCQEQTRNTCSTTTTDNHGGVDALAPPRRHWTSRLRTTLRPKFVLAGFLFGGLMEYLYVHSIRKGYASLQQTAPSEYSVRLDSWTDVLFYEMSFMFTDVLFFFYAVLLARSAMRRNLSMNLAINAANWVVGMVVGLCMAVSTIVGVHVVLQRRCMEVLASLVVGVLMCFVAYATAVECQIQFPCLFLPRSSSSASEDAGVGRQNQEVPQELMHRESSTYLVAQIV